MLLLSEVFQDHPLVSREAASASLQERPGRHIHARGDGKLEHLQNLIKPISLPVTSGSGTKPDLLNDRVASTTSHYLLCHFTGEGGPPFVELTLPLKMPFIQHFYAATTQHCTWVLRSVKGVQFKPNISSIQIVQAGITYYLSQSDIFGCLARAIVPLREIYFAKEPPSPLFYTFFLLIFLQSFSGFGLNQHFVNIIGHPDHISCRILCLFGCQFGLSKRLFHIINMPLFLSLILASIVSCYLMFQNICLFDSFQKPSCSQNLLKLWSNRGQESKRSVKWNKANDQFVFVLMVGFNQEAHRADLRPSPLGKEQVCYLCFSS